ncbi:hypothetical protein [Bradyrhizobium elkanii]|uniref:hypothetical protein n=1 Tax=Bradyrhizobium elkanii TaxID=29448 RepID=UPI001BA9BF35|nr:hypothetical protein [Bradyrhizobium elkanii]MBR1158103.1 hypothetical protein [Bradyrhizobium elkanii]
MWESHSLRHRFSAAQKSFKNRGFSTRRFLAVEHHGVAPGRTQIAIIEPVAEAWPQLLRESDVGQDQHVIEGSKQHDRIRDYLATSGRAFRGHWCGDGGYIFSTAVDHVHHAKAGLKVLHLLNELIAEGMIVDSPYEEGGDGNNISYSTGLTPLWIARLKSAMSARLFTKPTHEWERCCAANLVRET